MSHSTMAAVRQYEMNVNITLLTTTTCAARPTFRPDQEPPGGAETWNAIPGARGCTPQSCAYRDHYAELRALGATVYGLSTQDTEYQSEAVGRLHLPFSLLSDARLAFARALRLPTFAFAGLELIKRLTLIARAGRIEEVFYPVFPSDADAERVVAWLTSHSGARADARR